MDLSTRTWFYITCLILSTIRRGHCVNNVPSCTNTIAYVSHHEPDLFHIYDPGIHFVRVLEYLYSRLRLIGSHRSEDILPIKRRTLLTENIYYIIYYLASMCENYSGPIKSGPIKRLTRLNSDPIKRSRLYSLIYLT